MLQRFVPDLHVQSIYHIDLAALKKAGIKGLITDLDNTLVAWNAAQATPKVAQWLDKVRDKYGIRVVIVSNNGAARVEEFARPLGIPAIYKARKPKNAPFQRALAILGTLPEETVVVGDQIFTDVFGGKRMGMYTILVVPVAAKEWIGTKFLRMAERLLLGILRRRGLITWEDRRR
jgi:HAD superfamily phosphatase (TIGR01668 family)